MAVPEDTCWAIEDDGPRQRFVTHTRLPVMPWPVRLPAPMPASWVPHLLVSAFALSLVTFIAATSAGHPMTFSVVAAGVSVFLPGCCLRPFAEVRLRREALSVLSVLYEGPSGSGDDPPEHC